MGNEATLFVSTHLPYLPVVFYLALEVGFAVVFFRYMIPRANVLTEPAEYRDYGKDKRKLMLRIMHRIEKMCRITKADEKITMKTFLTEWFHVEPKKKSGNKKPNENASASGGADTSIVDTATADAPEITYTPSSSPENSDDDDDCDSIPSAATPITTTTTSENDIIQLYKQEMDDFFAWAFYGKFHSQLEGEELKELDRIYKELEDRHDLVFPLRKSDQQGHTDVPLCKPRCMTLEPVNAIYRPLLVYLIVYAMKIGSGLLLRLMGFRRIVASTGLVAWHRPSKISHQLQSSSFMPMLFFHGIAPGGFILYLPMLFFGLATEPDRPIFIFENRSISCAIDFHPLTEQQTVDGVIEVLESLGMDQQNLSLVGHSFGSCLITWVLASKRLKNVKQVVLIDPVAILLSEPDVMVNFLYAQELDKIRMVASSELFTEYYLRRHFAWYNSELWLEDVDCPMLIGLSEKDEIINARKVKQEVERHGKFAKLVYWEGVGHGACIQSPTKWREMKELMLQQELQILQQYRQ
jgi:pimeloyl-ACP methyl ester carboxylesterase